MRGEAEAVQAIGAAAEELHSGRIAGLQAGLEVGEREALVGSIEVVGVCWQTAKGRLKRDCLPADLVVQTAQ